LSSFMSTFSSIATKRGNGCLWSPSAMRIRPQRGVCHLRARLRRYRRMDYAELIPSL
jgi:hypothetical protein